MYVPPRTPDTESDSPWYRPSFSGMAEKFTDLQLEARKGFTQVSAGTSPFAVLAAAQIRSQVRGDTQIHYVNALDPGTAGYLRPEGDLGPVVPVRRA